MMHEESIGENRFQKFLAVLEIIYGQTDRRTDGQTDRQTDNVKLISDFVT